MGFASGCPPSGADGSSPPAGSGAASGCLPEPSVPSGSPTRLKRRAEFVRVARSGRSWASGGVVLQVWRRDDRDRMQQSFTGIRVGITASRKVGNAVTRNRVRRRLREAARQVLPACAAPGRDYVLVGRVSTADRPFAALLADLQAALRRLGAYRACGNAPASEARAVPLPEGHP